MLEATLDDVIEFKRNSEEEDRQRAMMIGGGAAAAGGLGYAGHKGRQAVINSHGVTDDYGNRVARRGMYKDAAKDAAKGAFDSVKQVPHKIGAATGKANDFRKSIPGRVDAAKLDYRYRVLENAQKMKRGSLGRKAMLKASQLLRKGR